MMVPVNGGGSGCGLGGWLEVRRVPANGWIEVCVACPAVLCVAMHWVLGRTYACGGEGCPLCDRCTLRTYCFLGVNVMGVGGKVGKAVLELPHGFCAGSEAIRQCEGRTGLIVRFQRDGLSRNRRIVETIKGDLQGKVALLVDEAEVYCSVAGVLGLQVTSEQLCSPAGRGAAFAEACATQALEVATK